LRFQFVFKQSTNNCTAAAAGNFTMLFAIMHAFLIIEFAPERRRRFFFRMRDSSSTKGGKQVFRVLYKPDFQHLINH